MTKTKKVLREEIKSMWMAKVKEWLEANGEEVVVYGSNKFAVPVVDSEGEEDWVTFTLAIPTGSRDGEAFDGYEMGRDWEMKCKEKEEKKAEKAKEKAAKIERDKKMREAKKKKEEEGE